MDAGPSREAGHPLRLHLNEHTAGCSPAVLAALRGLSRTQVSFYPDYGPITRAVERHFDVPAGWVLLTNGLDEGLHLAALVRGTAPRQDVTPFDAIVPEPAFEMFGICAETAGGRVVHVPPRPDFAFTVGDIAGAATARTELVYVADPNNPTGLGIPAGGVDALATALPRATIVIDEAYADYSGRTLIGPLLDRRRNVVVGRTFAKAHGLAALRAGALVAHPETLAPLRRLQPPFSVNVATVVALAAALEDRAYVAWSVAQANESKALIYEACRRLGLGFWPSEANFVLVRVGDDAGRVAAALAARGILVRDCSRQPGCAGCVRITAGVVEHTRTALGALEAVLTAGA